MRRKLSRILMADVVLPIMLAVTFGWHSLKCLFSRLFGLPEPELFGISETGLSDTEDDNLWVYQPADLKADAKPESIEELIDSVTQRLRSHQRQHLYGSTKVSKWPRPEPKVFTIPATGLSPRASTPELRTLGEWLNRTPEQ